MMRQQNVGDAGAFFAAQREEGTVRVIVCDEVGDSESALVLRLRNALQAEPDFAVEMAHRSLESGRRRFIVANTPGEARQAV